VTTSERVLVHVRIPESLLQRLDAEADKRMVSRNLMVSAAITELLEDLDKETHANP
jgi:metal-responsive CopG/Arc/MetJ family transcriptional regulator